MLSGSGIIKTAMTKRGYKHRRTDEQFSVRGEYTRNLQFAYSKETPTQAGRVVDLVYFAADVLNEKLVIGLYRENPDLENGVYVNASRTLDLENFNEKGLDRVLDQFLTRAKDKLK
jgi:hypothetical protein